MKFEWFRRIHVNNRKIVQHNNDIIHEKKTQIITCTCYIYKKSLPKAEIPASAINKKDTKVFKRHESKNNIG